MGLLPFKCGIDGCKKSKLQKHTHTMGDMRNFSDRRLLEEYRVYAQMRGEPVRIPGGDSSDMAHYMRNQIKAGAKEAAKFRKSEELKAAKEAAKKKEDEKKRKQAEKDAKKKR